MTDPQHAQHNPVTQHPRPGFPAQDQPRPGPVWTPLIPATLPDTVEFGKQAPLGRPAQPAEVATAYVCLASQEASFITAESLNATGGTPLP